GERWDVPAKEVMGGKGSYGNGAAMRVVPVGLLYNNDLDKVREVAEATSRVTHTHILGVEGAVLQALGVAMATRSGITEEISRDEFLRRLVEAGRCEEYLTKLNEIGSLLSKPFDQREIVERLGNGGGAQNSVPAAIFFFLSFPADFRKTVLNSAALGGDADTIAS
ncbi:MAG: ADP-ribosylglycohydrolase family protein, partial [Candidatus Hadarchaeales archaeon]